ncbi:MAG: polysaccharide biosynthesis/export family protein [Ideonella sp.]|nr:polysaccharide biosynthesis/export family protein [Ideonella sp.]
MNPTRQVSLSLARVLRFLTGLMVVASLAACGSLKPPVQTAGAVPFLRLDLDGQMPAATNASEPGAVLTGLDVEPSLPPYRFGVGDEFDLRVPDAPQLDLALKVRPDGKVSLPSDLAARRRGARLKTFRMKCGSV